MWDFVSEGNVQVKDFLVGRCISKGRRLYLLQFCSVFWFPSSFNMTSYAAHTSRTPSYMFYHKYRITRFSFLSLAKLWSMFFLVLQRVEPMLCEDRNMGRYTRAFSRQSLGKHVPVAKRWLCKQRPLLHNPVYSHTHYVTVPTSVLKRRLEFLENGVSKTIFPIGRNYERNEEKYKKYIVYILLLGWLKSNSLKQADHVTCLRTIQIFRIFS
jgi:hypothetical protein